MTSSKTGIIRVPIEYFVRVLTNELIFDLPKVELKRFYVDHAHNDLVLIVDCEAFAPRPVGTLMANYICSFKEKDGKTVMTINIDK